jgi:hypothetical protein
MNGTSRQTPTPNQNPPSARRAMFIDSAAGNTRPPSGGPCADRSARFRKSQSHIALLTEGRLIPLGVSINMALLAEGA